MRMNTITISCHQCQKPFQKLKKEFDRQVRKHGPDRWFFCSRSCSCRYGNEKWLVDRPKFFSPEAAALGTKNAAISNSKYTDKQRPFVTLLANCRKRKHFFDLDVDFLVNLWVSQLGRCALSNIALSLEDDARVFEKVSVDRIDSSKGYTSDNVQLVSRTVNLAKNTMSDADVAEFLDILCESYLPTKARGDK